jgi:hypothetical protein
MTKQEDLMGSIRKVAAVVGVLGLTAFSAAPAFAASSAKSAPAAGTSGQSVVSATSISNPNGSQSFGSVSCPAGSLRTGGGVFGSLGFGGGQQSVNSSYPSGNGWAAYMNNATGVNGTFNVYAVCLS